MSDPVHEEDAAVRGRQIELTPEQLARRQKRNRAIALGIAGLCLLFYVISLIKMGASLPKRLL